MSTAFTASEHADDARPGRPGISPVARLVEEIVQRYDSLRLPDVQQVAGYYLKEELTVYFRIRAARGGKAAYVPSGVVPRACASGCLPGTPDEIAGRGVLR